MPKCTQPANEVFIIKPDSLCRSMTEVELRSVLDECVLREVSPKALASLADFETLTPQLKKIVKQMNKDINGKIKK